MVLLLILTDAKIATLSSVLGCVIFFAVARFRSGGWRRRLQITAVSFAVCILVFRYGLPEFRRSLEYELVVANYVEGGFSKKPGFFDASIRRLKHDNPLIWYFGAGPGQFGSVANELLSADVIYSPRSYHLPFSSSWTKRYMDNVSDEEFFEGIHAARSFVLSTYYSSLVAIKNELGLVGFGLFVSVVVSLLLELARSMGVTLGTPCRNFQEKGIKFGLGVIFVGAFVFSAVDPTYENAQLINPLMFLLAFIMPRTVSNGVRDTCRD